MAHYHEIKQHFLNAAMHVSPTDKEQQGFIKLLHEMEKAGEKPNEVYLRLAAAIYDGLAFGNWPTI